MQVLFGFWLMSLGVIFFRAMCIPAEWHEKLIFIVVAEAIVMALSGGVYLISYGG